jgi:2'-5' RNA ligase
MRVFFACLFKDTDNTLIYEEILNAKAFFPMGNYTLKENIHVTVEFIGDVDDTTLTELKTILHSFSYHKFSLEPLKLDYFNKGNKQILFLGLKGDEPLLECNKLLRSYLRNCNISFQDKPYISHITLARNVQDVKELEKINMVNQNSKFLITKLSLMESLRIDDKLVYRELDYQLFE